MKPHRSFLIAAACGAWLHAAPPPRPAGQAPQAVQAAERAKLLEGVSAIPRLGAPGPVAVFALRAFPVIAAGSDGKAQMALCAAAELGGGRAVIFGHTGYLDATSANADVLKLLENAARWCAAPSGRTNPRVGVRNGGSETMLGKRGFEARRFAGKLDAAVLGGFDVVILSTQGMTDGAEAEALEQFIRNGGGCIAAATGWAFPQTSGGKDLIDEHAGNRALRDAGLAWTEMLFPDQVRSFDAKADLPGLINASEAILALRNARDRRSALGEEDTNQALSSIQIALSAQSSDRAQQVAESVMGALGKSEGAVPTPEKPVRQTEKPGDRMRLIMESRVMKIAAVAKVAAHPAAAHFPGKVPAEARRVTQRVEIDPSVPGWHSTGLYAAPGEKITVTVPAGVAGGGFALRIGCHTDTLYHLESWSRAPDISRSVRLKEVMTETASAFGGLVYLEAPGSGGGKAPFTATIAGAVEAPLFVLGRDDDRKWNETLKRRPAPWAEFASDKIILSCPSDVARRVTNPTQLMAFWKKVVEDQDEISNQAAERRRPERIVADVQISAGYMHSGYPIMVPTSAAPEMVTFNKIKFPGWGFYHELGHNHQRGDFTFDGTGEVTNNVLALHVFEAVLGKDKTIGHGGVSPESQKKHVEEIRKAGDKFALWKKEPFLALTTYIQLVDAFGWDAWKKYLHSFGDPGFGPAPRTDDEKRDQFLVRYFRIVNRNLGPFFEFWGIPVSPGAKSGVASLEPWMPKGVK